MLHKSEKLCLDILTAIEEIRNFLAEALTASCRRTGTGRRACARRWLSDRFAPIGVNELGAPMGQMSEQIIGEALKRLERADEKLFDQIENGRKIIGMRNVLAHGYDVIDYRILWSTVTHDIEPLARQIECLLNE